MTSPPMPYLFATFSSEGNGWRTSGSPNNKRLTANKLVVGNKGESMLDEVIVTFNDKRGREIVHKFDIVPSGAQKPVELNSSKFTLPINITMSEKYGLGLD